MAGTTWGSLWGGVWGGTFIITDCLKPVTDVEYRQLLKAQIARNFTNCSIPDIVSFFSVAFDLDIHVVNRIGSVILELPRKPTQFELAVIEAMAPIKAGVQIARITYSETGVAFGFDNTPNTGFGQIPATFVNGFSRIIYRG